MAGSGVRFKTNEDVLLAFSSMDDQQRLQFRQRIREELKNELNKFEKQSYFQDYLDLKDAGQLKNVDLEKQVIPIDLQEIILTAEEANDLIKADTYEWQLQETQQNIQNLLNGNFEINNKKLEKNLKKSLESIKSFDTNSIMNP
jgi:hypothetical protein